MGQLSSFAPFEVILECTESNTFGTMTAETLVRIFDALVGPMGSTNIFESNPFVSATHIPGPCDGVSLIAFQFHYDAVCPHIALIGEATAGCCDSLSSSSSSSLLPITGQRLLQIGHPTRAPKLVVTVTELSSSSSSSSSTLSSSSSSSLPTETIDMLLSQGMVALDVEIPYIQINNVILWEVNQTESDLFIASDGTHDDSAHNLYLISHATLTDALIALSPLQFVDPGLSYIGDMSLADSDRQILANRIAGWASSMAAMWPGSKYALQGNISAPMKISVGSSMLYWSQIHGSTRALAYSSLRSQLFEINRNASSYSVNYTCAVNYDNPVVFGRVRNALDVAGVREHVNVSVALMFDMFNMIGSKECRVAISPVLGYGVQMLDGDPVAFYTDAVMNGTPTDQAHGVGYTSFGPVPSLVSVGQVSEVASVFRASGLPLRLQLSFDVHLWLFLATTDDMRVTVPVDTSPSSEEYEVLVRQARLSMHQHLSRYFFRELLGEQGDPANTPPSGYPSWQNPALRQSLQEAMDGLAVQYLQAIRGI